MPSARNSIDYEGVRRYFNDAADGESVAASYMAHGQDLPPAAVRYRFAAERRMIADWLDEVPKSATVLDAGCGAGAWTRVFADRYARVFGVDASSSMVEAARKHTRNAANVEIMEGDVQVNLPDHEFQLAYLGGLCMYLNDDDVVSLLSDLKDRVGNTGAIVLRESTVLRNRRAATGDYQATYRTVRDYEVLFAQVGFSQVETRRNYGYTSMEIAIELVEARRRWLPFLPRHSTLLGSMTWWCLRLTSPVSFWAVPRALNRLNVAWPSLQNHFFRLTT